MKLSYAFALAAFAVVMATAPLIEARPEQQSHQHGHMEASGSTESHDESGSHEAGADDMSSEENSTAAAKAAQCPPRQPDILQVEAECTQEERAECTSQTPTADPTETTEAEATAMTSEMTPVASSTDDHQSFPFSTEAPMETTAKHGRRHRKRSCNYHLCVLKKLEVLDSSDMPDKNLLSNWIANNITDEGQREKLQHKFSECTVSLKDIFAESKESLKSMDGTQDDVNDDKKTEESLPKKKSCITAKKVISCLSKTIECPVLKF